MRACKYESINLASMITPNFDDITLRFWDAIASITNQEQRAVIIDSLKQHSIEENK